MKTLFTSISLLLTFAFSFDFFNLIAVSEIAINWIAFSFLIIFVLCIKSTLPSALAKCKSCFTSMQNKTANHWTDIFALNTKEWSTTFSMIAPFSIILIGIGQTTSEFIPYTAFLNTLFMSLPVVISMSIVFMFLSVLYNTLFLDKKARA